MNQYSTYIIPVAQTHLMMTGVIVIPIDCVSSVRPFIAPSVEEVGAASFAKIIMSL